MEILDRLSGPAAQKEVSATKEQLLDTTRLEQKRKKKRRGKRRKIALAFLVLVAVLVWLTGIGSLYFAKLGSLWETFDLQLHPGQGFPLQLSMGLETRAAAMTGAAVLMDEQDVFVYSDTGSALRSFRHGYARPGLSVGDTRFCVYNRGGRELRIEGRTQSYGTLTTAKAIQFVTMSQSGNFAVVTQSDSYQAQMHVYNYTMDEIFSWYCAGEYPTTAAFAPAGLEVAVGCITSGAGELQSVLYLVDEEGQRLSIERPNSMILGLNYPSADRLLVAYDDALLLYETRTMQVLASYTYTDNLLCCDLSGKQGILLVQGDASREAGVALTILTPTLEVARSVAVGDMVQQCAIQAGRAWLIGKNKVFCYTIEETSGEDTVLQPEHRPLCLITGGRNLLLLTARQLVELDTGQG